MYRVDSSTASATLPIPLAAGTPGYFCRADSSKGQSATVAGPDWHNMVQEELAHVVEQSGLTLTKDNHTQLYQAIQVLIGDAVTGDHDVARISQAEIIGAQWSFPFGLTNLPVPSAPSDAARLQDVETASNGQTPFATKAALLAASTLTGFARIGNDGNNNGLWFRATTGDSWAKSTDPDVAAEAAERNAAIATEADARTAGDNTIGKSMSVLPVVYEHPRGEAEMQGSGEYGSPAICSWIGPMAYDGAANAIDIYARMPMDDYTTQSRVQIRVVDWDPATRTEPMNIADDPVADFYLGQAALGAPNNTVHGVSLKLPSRLIYESGQYILCALIAPEGRSVALRTHATNPNGDRTPFLYNPNDNNLTAIIRSGVAQGYAQTPFRLRNIPDEQLTSNRYLQYDPGTGEMDGDNSYSAPTVAWVVQPNDNVVFNALRLKFSIWDPAYDISWWLYKRSVFSGEFSTENDTPITSGTIDGFEIKRDFRHGPSLIRVGKKVSLKPTDFLYVVMTSTDGTRIGFPVWQHDAAVARSVMLVSESSGWLTQQNPTKTLNQTSYQYGYGLPGVELLLLSDEAADLGITERNQLPATIPVALAPESFAIVGQQMNWYYANLIPWDAKLFKFDHIPCTASDVWALDECLRMEATTARTVDIPFNVYNKFSQKPIYKGKTTVHVASANTGAGLTRVGLIIGDSHIASGRLVKTLVDTLVAGGMEFTTIGTQGSGIYKHEGHSGQTITYFYNNSACPMVNPATGKFDFPWWRSTHGFARPNIVYCNLGSNEETPFESAVTSKINSEFPMLEEMIESIHSDPDDGANIVVALCLTIPPAAHQDAYGAISHAEVPGWRMHESAVNWNCAMIAQFGNRYETDKIVVLGTNAVGDTEHGYSFAAAEAVNSRSSVMVVRQNEGMHPPTTGDSAYDQEADVFSAAALYLIT